MNLITVQEFTTYRSISKKVDTEKVEEAISLAQQSDLLNILGDFYFDVLKNADTPEYADLMSGSEFDYCDESFEHQGIKKLLGDFAYARYVYSRNTKDTPFGMVTKTTQDSTPVDRNTLRDISKQAQVDAGIKFTIIEKYILSEPTLFSRYCKNKQNNTGFSSIKISRL